LAEFSEELEIAAPELCWYINSLIKYRHWSNKVKMANQPEQTPNIYALLIGIDGYKPNRLYKNLKGACVTLIL
jgi:hypothetical protein